MKDSTISGSAEISVPVLEWNLAIASQSRIHARRQMRAIARLTPIPRVLVLLETSRSVFPSYISALEVETGLRWDGVFQAHCAGRPWNSDGRCPRFSLEGVTVLTSYPIVSAGTRVWPFKDRWHSGRAGVRVAVDVGGSVLQVFGTHLQAGWTAEAAHARLQSIALLADWVGRFPSPAIIGGDFNQVPSGPEVTDRHAGLLAAFKDAWTEAGSSAGETYPAGSPRARIDYWFFTGSARVHSTDVVTTTRLSDHYPLRAAFIV